jgi:hypothetical protein
MDITDQNMKYMQNVLYN